MSLFKKIANFCRNSNDRADARNGSYDYSYHNSTVEEPHVECCRTCRYSTADGLRCQKHSCTISFYDRDNSKCFYYDWDEVNY